MCFRDLAASYWENVYPTHPVISKEALEKCWNGMSNDREDAAFVYATAAACLQCTPGNGPVRLQRLEAFLTKATQSLGPITMRASISAYKIMTCVFLANCLVATNDAKTAFLYLRHAVSMIETFRLRSVEGNRTTEDARLRRLYWLLYVHERYQCISEYRTVQLKPLPDDPIHGENDPDGMYLGFIRIVRVFRLMDEAFVAYWLGESGLPLPTKAWVTGKCEELYTDERDASIDECKLSVAQRVDLMVTRHWLLILVWRIAMSNKLLGDTPSSDCLSLLYPLHVAHRLQSQMEDVSEGAIGSHGVGIIQKLFELTDTVADVALHVPSSLLEESDERLDRLRHLWEMFSLYSKLDSTRKSILDDKLHRISQLWSA